MKFAAKTHRPVRGKMNIGRAQNQLVDCYHTRCEMIFGLRLIEMELGELFDLEKLTERDEEVVLPKLTIVQKDLAASGKRVRVGRFSLCLQITLELSLQNSARSACFGDNLIRLYPAELHFDSKR